MNLEKVLSRRFDNIEVELTARDCMLYALGIGVGDRATDPADLQFCYEKNLAVFPSMVNVVAYPGAWVADPELGIDWVKALHGEQFFSIDRPLEPGKAYVGSYRILDVVDKGAGKGALVYFEKVLREKGSDAVSATVIQTTFLRGDGGAGGTTTETRPIHALPDRAPDGQVALTTLPQAALIYRLSGDYNPIHADPAMGRNAGFERPILHGLCTLGVATRALLRACCGEDPALLKSLQLRFSSPVFPGETVVTEYWRDGKSVHFRSSITERNVVVLNNGYAELR